MAFAQIQGSKVSLASKPSNRRVQVHAQKSVQKFQKRDILQLGYVASNLVFLQQARALLPNDEDDDLINKAKAQKADRLKAQQKVVKDFAKTEGFSGQLQDVNVAKIQEGIYKIAEAGEELEQNKAVKASETLRGGWLSDFASGARALEKGDTTGQVLVNGIQELEKSTGVGDNASSKRRYVALVDEINEYVNKVGIKDFLKGL